MNDDARWDASNPCLGEIRDALQGKGEWRPQLEQPIGEDAANGAIGKAHAIDCRYTTDDNPWAPCTCGVGGPNDVPAANGEIGEREVFEAWGNETFNYGFQPETWCDGSGPVAREAQYTHEGTQMAWDGWKARAALHAEKVAAEPVADPKHDLHARMKIAREAGLALRIDEKFGSDHYHSVTGSWPAVCRFAWALYNTAPQPAQTQAALTDETGKKLPTTEEIQSLRDHGHGEEAAYWEGKRNKALLSAQPVSGGKS